MKRKLQSQHDRIVKYVSDHLRLKIFRNIKADIRGYKQPKKITWKLTGKGHIPDVTGQSLQLNLFEVETSDSISHSHTADQWRLFAAYARGNRAVFWVVVPRASEAAARRRLNQLNISAKVWGV